MVSRNDRIYYERELAYLKSEGEVFARNNPEIAYFLGLSESEARLRDPHAERIVEAFAFLTGKLNRHLDAQYPELVHSLFDLLFPQYLHPSPAKTLAEFSVEESMLDKPQPIPRGTELYAPNMGPDNRRYTFTTAWDIWIQPIRITKVYCDPEAPGDYSLSLVLELHKVASPDKCDWDKLEFALVGDPTTRLDLFYQFAENLLSLGVRDLAGPPLEIDWCGFGEEHNYVDEDRGRFSRLHHLRDYFDDPRRYLFFRIRGLQELLAPAKERRDFQLDFSFSKPFATGVEPKTENIKLHCVIAQNLFVADCEPFVAEETGLEYLLTPDSERADIEVCALQRVVATKAGAVENVRPYFHFDHGFAERQRHHFYALRRDTALDQGWNTRIRFLEKGHVGPGALAGQTISVRALCSNRHYAQDLKPGQLRMVANSIPETISVKNISLATKAAWPLLHSGGEWDFLAHLALDYTELYYLPALKNLLTLYHVSREEAGLRKIEGIKTVTGQRDFAIHHGCCIQGQRLTMEVVGDHFVSLGDIALFTRVFGRFLDAYCPINGFIRLQVRETASGRSFDYLARG